MAGGEGAIAGQRGSRGAGAPAFAARQAAAFKDQQFRPGRLALRIVAPGAVERAALEKDGRADAGSVLDGVPLEVKDESGFHAASQRAAIA